MKTKNKIIVIVLLATLAWVALWVTQVEQCRNASSLYCVD